MKHPAAISGEGAMTQNFTAVFVGPPALGEHLGVPAEALREDGHETLRFHSAAALLDDPSALARADVILAGGGMAISRAVLEKAPRLRAVLSPYIGVEGFDEAAATELGVLIVNNPVPENYQSMAEATVLMMLAASYDLPAALEILDKNLPRPMPRDRRGRMLRGKTVGLIGFGQIARAVAERLAGWDVRLQAHTRRPDQPLPPEVARASLHDLLRTSDIVSILTPLTPQTRKMIGAAELRLLKHEAILVNTARGGIVDEAALVAFMRERPDVRLALDAFEVEPLPPDSPLRAIPHAVLTPHMIGHTTDTNRAGRAASIEGMRRVLAGREPAYVLNPAILPAWTARWGGA
jgi:D-3-phosphoglycerate dehydrogenase